MESKGTTVYIYMRENSNFLERTEYNLVLTKYTHLNTNIFQLWHVYNVFIIVIRDTT